MVERGIQQVWKCHPALPAIIRFQCHSKNSLTGTADEMQNGNYATVKSKLKKGLLMTAYVTVIRLKSFHSLPLSVSLLLSSAVGRVSADG